MYILAVRLYSSNKRMAIFRELVMLEFFPTPVVILVIVLIITAIIMNKTKMGRHMYAVGGNQQAAEFSGIKVEKVKFFVHAFSGLMAGLAGIVLASRMYSGQPTVVMELKWMLSQQLLLVELQWLVVVVKLVELL